MKPGEMDLSSLDIAMGAGDYLPDREVTITVGTLRAIIRRLIPDGGYLGSVDYGSEALIHGLGVCGSFTISDPDFVFPGSRLPPYPQCSAGTYIASRASLPERSAAWRRLRDTEGWKITSTWIDEAGAGESSDLGLLWTRIESEIARSERLILYVDPGDFPLKGALIEVGMALAHRIPIRVVAPGVVLDPVSFRPLGSWVRHPLVSFVDTMEDALVGTTFSL